MTDAMETPMQYASIRASTSETSTLHDNHDRRASRSSLHTKKSQESSRLPQKESRRDPNLDVNLPYRTLAENANLQEYTTEVPSGEIPAATSPAQPEKSEYKLVTWLPNDPENPKNWSKAYKWYCTMTVAVTCFVVAFCSSVVTADLIDVENEFNVSEEVVLLTITMFVVGFGVGKFSVITPFQDSYPYLSY